MKSGDIYYANLDPTLGSEAAGWKLDRVTGSHHIMVKDGYAVPVPVHGSRDLGNGLVATIQKQTGVKFR